MSQPTRPSETTDQKGDDKVRHTPGPWIAVTGKGVHHRDWYITCVTYLDSDSFFKTPSVARTCSTGIGTSRTVEANARLIAAAPDLLAACKAALELAEGDDPGAGCDTREEAEAARCRWRESIEQSIRAAIAKAEGGAA